MIRVSVAGRQVKTLIERQYGFESLKWLELYSFNCLRLFHMQIVNAWLKVC
jgi:hypothetical protein